MCFDDVELARQLILTVARAMEDVNDDAEHQTWTQVQYSGIFETRNASVRVHDTVHTKSSIDLL